MKNYKVTFGLPAFKVDFLSEAINSILSQSFDNFQLIILNDNPGSKVKNIVDQFEDERIIYFENEENIGSKNLIDCWNKLLSFVKTEFFILASDDDIYDEKFLEILIKLSEKYPKTSIFYSRCKVIDSNNKVKYITASAPEFETASDFIWHRIKNYRMFYAPNFLVKTEDLKRIGGFVNVKKAWGADDLTWFRLSNLNGIVSTSYLLFNWRESEKNISRLPHTKDKFDAIIDYYIILDRFLQDELLIKKDEKIILEEILKNIEFRKSINFAHVLKTSCKDELLSYLKIFYLWFINRKKYNFNLTSLVWAFLLLSKDLKGK
jgi:glycosyltransferase involved in cell wall biosynthesis